VTELIREEIKKFLEFNENVSTIYQNPWGTAKAMLRGKFITINAYIKKTENSHINNPMMHVKLLEKQEQTKLKTSRQRKIIKVRAEINEIKSKQTLQRINETKSWFFEKTNKIDEPLANMTKWRKETQINKICNVIGLGSHDKARAHTGGMGICKKPKKHDSI
jgi:hypothetical protein